MNNEQAQIPPMPAGWVRPARWDALGRYVPNRVIWEAEWVIGHRAMSAQAAGLSDDAIEDARAADFDEALENLEAFGEAFPAQQFSVSVPVAPRFTMESPRGPFA